MSVSLCRIVGPAAVFAWFAVFGSVVAAPPDADPLAKEARAAMEKATAFMRSIATKGGYVWRYSLDLSERAGERPTTPTQIWIQAPGTPAVGMAFLRAHAATGDGVYLEAAKAAADALVFGQLESGGWDYLVDFDPEHSKRWYRRADVGSISADGGAPRRNLSTYDDDTTQGALRFLTAVADVSKESTEPRDVRIREARDYGLRKLVEAQRPNGGWPQRWDGVPVTAAEYPPVRASIPEVYPREHQRENYYGHYTLNDQTHRDCVRTLLEAAEKLGREEYRAAALKGGDFLIDAQLPEPQPGWAQQYNARMEPAWARAFEPPSVSSNESSGVMHLLVDLHVISGEEKYLGPLPKAIAWLKRSELRPNVWARLYELGTNRAIYGDRDGKIHYTLDEVSPERKRGYAWEGAYSVPSAIAAYEAVKQHGRAAALAKRAKSANPPTPAQKAARIAKLAPRVRDVIAALDAEGRWLRAGRDGEWILTSVFIANLDVLSEYVAVAK